MRETALRLAMASCTPETHFLVVSGDPSEMEHAAEEVDELMTTIAKAGNNDSTRIAVLACLHLQDRLRTGFASPTTERRKCPRLINQS